jgi:hypothetical protein
MGPPRARITREHRPLGSARERTPPLTGAQSGGSAVLTRMARKRQRRRFHGVVVASTRSRPGGTTVAPQRSAVGARLGGPETPVFRCSAWSAALLTHLVASDRSGGRGCAAAAAVRPPPARRRDATLVIRPYGVAPESMTPHRAEPGVPHASRRRTAPRPSAATRGRSPVRSAGSLTCSAVHARPPRRARRVRVAASLREPRS